MSPDARERGAGKVDGRRTTAERGADRGSEGRDRRFPGLLEIVRGGPEGCGKGDKETLRAVHLNLPQVVDLTRAYRLSPVFYLYRTRLRSLECHEVVTIL